MRHHDKRTEKALRYEFVTKLDRKPYVSYYMPEERRKQGYNARTTRGYTNTLAE